MSKFLILYGADNDMATFEADHVGDAVNLFCKWEPVSPSEEENLAAINEVYELKDMEWRADQ